MKVEVNNPTYLNEFIRLNELWISTYFAIEEADRKLAANPHAVIDAGGYIFTILEREKVVGVCALFHEGEGVFELARMAVDPESQGKGYGDALMDTSLQKLGEINAKRVYLISNTILTKALSMYRKYGFLTTSEGQHPIYSRADIVMEKKL